MNENFDESNDHWESLATTQEPNMSGMKSSCTTSQQDECHNILTCAKNYSNGEHIENSDTMPHLRSNGYVQNTLRNKQNSNGGLVVRSQGLGIVKRESVAREVRELTEPFLNYQGQEQRKKPPKPQGPFLNKNVNGTQPVLEQKHQQDVNIKHQDQTRNGERQEQRKKAPKKHGPFQTKNVHGTQQVLEQNHQRDANFKHQQEQTRNGEKYNGPTASEGVSGRNLQMLSDAGSNLRDREQKDQGTKITHHHQGKENDSIRGPKTATTAAARTLQLAQTASTYKNYVQTQDEKYNHCYYQHHEADMNASVCSSYDNQEDAGDFLQECDDVSDEGGDFQGDPAPTSIYGSGYIPVDYNHEEACAAARVSCNQGERGNEEHRLGNVEENLGNIFIPARGGSNASTEDHSSLDKSVFEKAYILDCQKKGILDDQFRLSSEARMVAREKAWKLYKFASPALMEYDSPMATMIMAEMGKLSSPYDSVFQSSLWTRIKKDVLIGIGQARSGSTQRIQKAFFGK